VHIAKGADLRIIGGVMGEDVSIITTKEKATEIKSVADLKGKKVATVRLATGDAVLRGALAGRVWTGGRICKSSRSRTRLRSLSQ